MKIKLNKRNENVVDILLNEDCIGKIILTYVNLDEYEISFYILNNYQDKHYAMQALYLFCNDYSYKKLYASINIEDKKSRHILTHNGFEIIKEENNLYLEKIKQYCSLTNFENKINHKWIVLAGGCFWGVEHVFRALKGVTSTICGYANGTGNIVNYAFVSTGKGNYKEAVAVEYNTNILSLETILDVFFLCIDPTEYQRQKEDIGKQYQTGIYYLQDEKEIDEYLNIKKKEYEEFYVEYEKINNFYTAEEYHQSYLDKHPNGYCHIPLDVMRQVKEINEKILKNK